MSGHVSTIVIQRQTVEKVEQAANVFLRQGGYKVQAAYGLVGIGPMQRPQAVHVMVLVELSQ
jgi:hypothetical protein